MTKPVSQTDVFRDVSGLVDHGPYNLEAGQTITVAVKPDEGVKQLMTSEIWNDNKSIKLEMNIGGVESVSSYKALTPITVWGRSYANRKGDGFVMTITRTAK